MAGDICHAWLHSPLPTMGPEDQPWMSFFSLPSFPGTLLSRTIGLLSPRHFLPAFNPSILLFFQPSLSASTRKQNKVETMTVHSPPSASVVLMTFCSGFMLCVCVNMLKLCLFELFDLGDRQTEEKNSSTYILNYSLTVLSSAGLTPALISPHLLSCINKLRLNKAGSFI